MYYPLKGHFVCVWKEISCMTIIQSYLVYALGSLGIFGSQTPKVSFVQDSSSQRVLEWAGGLMLFVQLAPWWGSFSNGPSEGLNDLGKK